VNLYTFFQVFFATLSLKYLGGKKGLRD